MSKEQVLLQFQSKHTHSHLLLIIYRQSQYFFNAISNLIHLFVRFHYNILVRISFMHKLIDSLFT